MTYFLNDFDPSKVPAPRGPDLQPQGFIDSAGAAMSTMMRDTDANFQRQRQRSDEEIRLAKEIGPRVGMVPDYPIHATDVLKAARDAAATDPEAWKGVDLTDEGIDQRVTDMRKREAQDEAELLGMSEYPATANLAGGVVGSMADVRNLPFLFMGGSGSFLKVVGQEALLGMAGEAVTLPSQFKTAEELDKADPNIAQQLTFGAIGGGVIGGATHALGRGLDYYRFRTSVPEVPSVEPMVVHDAMDAAEAALMDRSNPLEAVQRVIASQPPPPPPKLPPLIPENPRIPPAVETSVLPPMAGDAPRSAAEVAAGASRALDEVQGLSALLSDTKAGDAMQTKPFVAYLTRGHKVPKGSGKTEGLSLQIDPAGTLGGELKSAGITAKSAPGLFKKGGRSDLDNLVASEMEDQFPGIIEATGTARDATYLDRQGVIDLIIRDANGDSSWLRSRADVQKVQADLDFAQRVADGEISAPVGDFLSAKQEPSGFFVDLNTYEFDGGGGADAIAADLDAYLVDRWSEFPLTEPERTEILQALQSRGGDAELMVEAIIDREAGYWEVRTNDPEQRPAAGIDRPDGTTAFVGETSTGGSGTSPAGAGDGTALEGPTQSRIGGTDTLDTGQAQRDRTTIAATQQQSKIRRLDQQRVEDDAGGLFSAPERDLFSDPTGKDARPMQDAIAADMRDQISKEDFNVDLNDGKGERSASSLLDELAADDEFQAVLDACGGGKP